MTLVEISWSSFNIVAHFYCHIFWFLIFFFLKNAVLKEVNYSQYTLLIYICRYVSGCSCRYSCHICLMNMPLSSIPLYRYINSFGTADSNYFCVLHHHITGTPLTKSIWGLFPLMFDAFRWDQIRQDSICIKQWGKGHLSWSLPGDFKQVILCSVLNRIRSKIGFPSRLHLIEIKLIFGWILVRFCIITSCITQFFLIA